MARFLSLKKEAAKKKIGSVVCINESLSDDELRSVLSKLERKGDKEAFGLVCKRWLYLQSTETKTLEICTTEIASHMLRKLAARFTNVVNLRLLSLFVDSCGGITDAGMVEIGRGLSSLRYLNVSYCSSLTDKGFSAVAEGCCNLQSLHCAYCRDVTDKVLETLSKNCHNLQVLEMRGCRNITDSGLKSLVNGCQLINWLDISFCPKITFLGIGILLNKCHSLEYLNVMSCPHVTKAGCDEAVLQFPKCCLKII